MKDTEIKSPGANGVSMDTAKTMTGGTNTAVAQGDLKSKSLNGDGVTSVAKGTNKDANVSKMNSMDKSGYSSVAKPL